MKPSAQLTCAHCAVATNVQAYPRMPSVSCRPAVSPERRGQLLRQGWCAAEDVVVPADGGGNATATTLAAKHDVAINDLIRVNTHFKVHRRIVCFDQTIRTR